MVGEFTSGAKLPPETVYGTGDLNLHSIAVPDTIGDSIPPIGAVGGEDVGQNVSEPLIGPHTVVADHTKPTRYANGTFSYPKMPSDWKELLGQNDWRYNKQPLFGEQGGWSGGGSTPRPATSESTNDGAQGGLALLERPTLMANTVAHVGKHALESTATPPTGATTSGTGESSMRWKFLPAVQPTEFTPTRRRHAAPTEGETTPFSNTIPLHLPASLNSRPEATSSAANAPEDSAAATQTEAIPDSPQTSGNQTTQPDSREPIAPPYRPNAADVTVIRFGEAPIGTSPTGLESVTHPSSANYARGQARIAMSAASVAVPTHTDAGMRFGMQQGAHHQVHAGKPTEHRAIQGGPQYAALPPAPAKTTAVVGEQVMPKHLAEQGAPTAVPRPEGYDPRARAPEQTRDRRGLRIGRIAVVGAVAGAAAFGIKRLLGGGNGGKHRA